LSNKLIVEAVTIVFKEHSLKIYN